MTHTRDLSAAAEPLTPEELQRALLDMTGDLDKARVLARTLPQWLVEADAEALAELEQVYLTSEQSRQRAAICLSRLIPLDRFCVERFEVFLLAKGVDFLDVEHDVLELPKRSLAGVGVDLGGSVQATYTYETHSLVQAAMQNFSDEQAAPAGMSNRALLRSAVTGEGIVGLSVTKFVGYCRELDLGCAYQAHIREVFNLAEPAHRPAEHSLGYNQAAIDIGQSKLLDLQIDLHIALAREHVSAACHSWLLKLIKADLPASDATAFAPGGKPLQWQGLNIGGACLWGVMLVSDAASGLLPTGSLLVYMPNEPQRPWYEYESLDDFTRYLGLKLQEPEYQRFFQRYLDESERLGFFRDFSAEHRLGALKPIVTRHRFSDFFFRACVGKIQLDAQVLAVPKAQADEEARQQLLRDYLDIGLNVLNVAGFVVPVLGQLMMGVAVGQLLGEVFDGVEDWNHGEHVDALKHLISVAQDIAAMALFAAGGRIVGSLKRNLAEPAIFFDGVEAVTRADHAPRLWRPNLRPYRQPAMLEQGWVANARGVYQARGGSYIKIDGSLYSISFDPGTGRWRINHPARAQAYRPALEQNYQGGWQHVHEHPQQWLNPIYHLNRIDPCLVTLPSEELLNLYAITELGSPDLRRLSLAHEGLPERFHDAVERLRQHRKILDLAFALDHGQPLDSACARTQMLALPLMRGWPKGRFFEVLNPEGDLLESYPDLAPFDYEDMSIHITEQQLKDGHVMHTLLLALNEEERAMLLGETAPLARAPTLLEQRLSATLKEHHVALHGKLYQEYNGVAQGELVPLVARYPHLPCRVAWELLSRATTAERIYLRNTGQLSLKLNQQVREALECLEEDQALMGLYWPQLTDASTQRLVFGMLPRLAGWPQGLALEMREQTLSGRLLAQVAPSPTGATSRRTIVQSAETYQAFDEHGSDLNLPTQGAEGLYPSVLDCLTRSQRITMNLMGEHGASYLRNQLRFLGEEERYRIAGYLRPEHGMPERSVACAQAMKGEPVAYPAGLMRKVRRLYPLYSDAQVSDFLGKAGSDHLTRATAVEALEQQFGALQRALKIWRSEKPAADARSIPRWDHRLSRHQAAKSLMRSWQHTSFAPDDFNLAVPSLVLDGMVLGRLPTLPPQVNFEHVQRLSMRNMQLSDDLAYFLKHFKGLTRLDLSGNQLVRLPEVLTQMPRLEHLYLSGNHLQMNEYARAKLAGIRTLKVLNLNENPLREPPNVGQMLDLRELGLRNCRLTEFPAGCQRLPRLEHLDLRQNEIHSLPDWLLNVPRRYAQAVNLRHNPLAARDRVALAQYRANVGVGMGFLEDDIARLNEQRARELWLPAEGNSDVAQQHLTWTGLKNEPGSDGLFKLLCEIGNTADARYVQEDLHQRVWHVLDAAAGDAGLREELFQRAATPLHCDDSAAVSFSALEIRVQIAQAARLVEGGRITAKPLLKLARGLFRLDRLERIARRHSASHPAADPLEVSLAFRTGLVDRFELPGQPQHMRFAQLGAVTPEALDSAEAQVKVAELSPDLLAYLVELPFWVDYLKQTFASRFDRLKQPFDERALAVLEEGQRMSDGDYHAQMGQILSEQREVEQREIERLSHDALRLDELGLCASPTG